ncbi:MAG: terminase small subunit [Variovorax sp.]|nr:MAG: terminase small subunit [Variovorax sp.]
MKKIAKSRVSQAKPRAVAVAVDPPVEVANKAIATVGHDRCGLTVREAQFVDLYLQIFRVGEAYVEAGYNVRPGPSAQACGSRLLSSAKARAYLTARTKAMFARIEEEQDNVLRTLVYVAYADPRELVEHWRGACRYCHGKFHRYQHTAGEWDALITKHAEKQEKAAEADMPAPKAPDPKGGVGYNVNAEPNPDCPECGGAGEGRTIVKDTRHLSPAALALYAGTKEGKDGIEVKMHDQMKAREMLAKIRKLYDDSTTVNININAEELDAIYGAAMRASSERMETMRRERLAAREARGDYLLRGLRSGNTEARA